MSPEWDVTLLLARRRVLPSDELRCIFPAVECYRRRRQTPESITSLTVRAAHAMGDATVCMWQCFTHVSSRLSIMLTRQHRSRICNYI